MATTRLKRAWRWVWYGESPLELNTDYVKRKLPPLDPLLDEQRSTVLDYAAQEHSHHRRVSRRMQVFYVAFQATTIVAAAAATVLAVAPPSWAGDWVTAIPSAIAALAAAALAAFRFERHWLRHRRAALRLKTERWSFVSRSGYYGDQDSNDGAAPARVIARFFARVDTISREGDEDVEEKPPDSGPSSS